MRDFQKISFPHIVDKVVNKFWLTLHVVYNPIFEKNCINFRHADWSKNLQIFILVNSETEDAQVYIF